MPASNNINTTNPESITYNTEEIAYTILGGIRLEGLDRLRVTIKVEVINRKFVHYLNNPDIAALAIRQNLDLYSITQTEKLARLIADRLEVGVTQVSKDLSDITNELERYRLQQIESKQQEQNKIIKPLTEAEKEAAIKFLQSKDLLQQTNELIGRSGIVGEELNRLIMWLIYTSRKTAKPLHIISMGSSGTGKSHLQEKVAELIPDEDKIEITALTENAFYYFDKAELGHKLILIEDLDGILAALYPIRELQRKQRISKTVTIKDKNGNTKTIHLKVHGPVCIAGCTTKESLYEDNANRCFLIYLDETSEQDERIGVGIPDGKTFDNDLKSDYTPTDKSGANVGKTVMRWADGSNSVQHGSVYMGTDNEGTEYTFSKNGWYVQPEITTTTYIEHNLSAPNQGNYGAIQGEASGETGYYNPK